MSAGARQTHVKTWDGMRRSATVPENAKHTAKKNTKRWCRGRVGVKHEPEWIRDARYDYGVRNVPAIHGWFSLVCAKCSRHLDYCYPMFNNECKCGNHVPREPKGGGK